MCKKLIDFYELTMAYTDMKNGKLNERCYFDVYFRKNLDNGGYNISCGIDDIVGYIKDLRFDEEDIEYLRTLNKFDEEFLDYLKDFKFKGDMYAIPDGTPIFPNEPCITVYGTTMEAQLIETDLLNKFNHGSLIATKAKRIVNEAKGRPVMEFGARRAQGGDAAMNGAKFAYIAGVAGTSCYETGRRFRIPLLGTMAHSHIMKYKTEYDSFLAYAKAFPDDCTFLVDTIDTLKSGVPNSIKVAKDYLIPNGYKLKAIRLDSGDLGYLSKEARKMLDSEGLDYVKICVSNSLDERVIKELIAQGAPIDSFGVGENLITSRSNPVFGGVYKLVAMESKGKVIPKIKISENVEKITNPGYKKVYRFYDKTTGYALGDVIANYDEIIPEDKYVLVDEKDSWKRKEITNYIVRELQVPIFRKGELVYDVPTLDERREYCENELATLYPEIKRLDNPHKYIVDLSVKMQEIKKDLLFNSK